MPDQGPLQGFLYLVAIVGGLGSVPVFLLFWDYHTRKEIHKPLIYIVVFYSTLLIILPFLLKVFGLWLALIAPFLVFGYALFTRAAGKKR